MTASLIQSAQRTVAALRLAVVAAIVVPVLLFGVAAWQNRLYELHEGEANARTIVRLLHEHALKVLETQELAIAQIDQHIRGMTWDEIGRSAEVHELLRSLDEQLEQVDAIALIDPSGHIRASSRFFPAPPEYVGDRDYFAEQKEHDAGFFIGTPYVGRLIARPQFPVSRRRTANDGSFDGVIMLTVFSEYFAGLYEKLLAGPNDAIALSREDGQILIRFPNAGVDRSMLPTDAPILRALEGAPTGVIVSKSPVDNRVRVAAFARLSPYPAYVYYGVDKASILLAWWDNVLSYGLVGGPATLALIGITVFALSRARREAAIAELLAGETAQRLRTESALRQAQKMEAVGQLTGGVAHDFNNMLTVVAGNLDLLEQHVSSDAAKKLLRAAQQGAERGARLTDSLLAFARRQHLRPETLNPNRLIKDFGDLLRHAVGEAIDIQLLLSPALDPCRLDPAQFQAALLNLVVNARDAMPATGGRISIETQNVVWGEAGRRHVAISVTDTGSGMKTDVLERAFEPFFTTKEIGKGSGLGLSQVYGFAKQSGGDVEITSEEGVGTRVRLYLPSVQDAPSDNVPSEASLAPPVRRGSETILVVEDDAQVRDTVSAALRSLGYRVLDAENARAALGRIEAGEPIDLVLSDIVMPGGISGEELARDATRLRRGLKVLLTTGYAGKSMDGAAAQDVAVLRKPYRQEELARAVRRALDG